MTNIFNNSSRFYLSIMHVYIFLFLCVLNNKNVDDIVKLTVVLIVSGVLILGCILLIS